MRNVQNPEPGAPFHFAPGTTFSITSHASLGEQLEVRWLRGDAEVLAMRLGPAAVARLRSLPPVFTAAALSRALGSRADASLALRHLLRRGLVRFGGRLEPSAPAIDAPRSTAALAVRGWCSTGPRLRITSRPLPVLDGTLPLRAFVAAIDDEWLGFGIGSAAADAESAARGEALERLGVLRPDLARTERHSPRAVAPVPARGFLFRCLRDFSAGDGPLGDPPADRFMRDRRTHRLRGSVPGTWLYIAASPAANTNGVAFGRTLAGALDGAQRELVERDRLLRAWYGRLPSHRLTASAVVGLGLAPCRDLALACGLTVRWFVLGTDRTPTVACVLHGDRAPHLGLGSATRATLADAAGKAFLEAAGSHLGHVGLHKEQGPAPFTAAVADAHGVPAAFHRSRFETYWAAQAPDAAAEIAARFSRPRISRRAPLAAPGFAWVDLTPRPIERGRVVKVLHPDAVPLPNSMAHVQMLEARLGVRGDGTPPPIG